MISYEDFKKVEIKIGKIISAEKILNTDKLLLLRVDFGTIISAVSNYTETSTEMQSPKEEKEARDIRQIVSGIALHFPDPLYLVGVKCAFVTNLEPRMIRGYESHGMILAVVSDESSFSLLKVDEKMKEGSVIR